MIMQHSVHHTTSVAPPIKRACDACHKRKVACRFLPNTPEEGPRACITCISANLACTYDAVPQKKGPKGNRARVITEIRETQQRSKPASIVQYRAHTPPSVCGSSDLLSLSLINKCAEFFFANVYDGQPILQRAQIAGLVDRMTVDPEAYCLILSLCAYMLMQPSMKRQTGLDLPISSDGSCSISSASLALLNEAVNIRRKYGFVETCTELTVTTSFFLRGCYHCLDNNKLAWYHLREATTIARSLGMHDEEFYKTLPVEHEARTRCLFWLLFVTERAYGIGRHQPVTLHTTIAHPSTSPEPSAAPHIDGFLTLISLYERFDDRFFGLWNKLTDHCELPWLIELQHTISGCLSPKLKTSAIQAIDLQVTQQWLKTIVWQLAISHGYLSSNALDQSLTFEYPIELGKAVVDASVFFSQTAMEVHGIGLVEKLFDIACAMIDVLSCVPVEERSYGFGPFDYLIRLYELVSTLRGGAQRFVPILVAKINESLPGVKVRLEELNVERQRKWSISSWSTSSSETTSAYVTPD